VNRRRLLQRIQSGAVANIAIADLEDLAIGLGFRLIRIRGSHRIYQHPDVAVNLNFQPRQGQAKPYQAIEIRRLVEMYNLKLED
jgi:predicted RNA binding protein YcfA (HicA-like mRNA interferase family)